MKDSRQSAISLLVGNSAPIEEVREMIAVAGPTALCVMIQGETGTGKDLAARAIHEARKRPGPFVAVNVCAIADSMFEDAFFGHVRGAFTGAFADRQGYLGEADRGTIFLDEITGLPLPAQAKLLRALETCEYRRVGDRTDLRSDFRVVAASNQSLDELVAAKLFRADLAFRLRGIELWMPALRDRRPDIGQLARYFAASQQSETGAPQNLDSDVIEALEWYDWPGNVRELRQVIARASAFAKGWPSIALAHLRRALPVLCTPSSAPCERLQRDNSDFSRRRLVEVLERHGWDTLSAATELEVTRKTVYMRLSRLGISIPRRYKRRGRGRASNDRTTRGSDAPDEPRRGKSGEHSQ